MMRLVLPVLAALGIGATPAGAAVLYSIGVDTSSISGQHGFLYLQFDAGNSDADLAEAAVSGFATNGVLGGPAMADGDVSPAGAALPGNVQFSNDQFPNDLFQPILFGSFLRFALTVSGDAVNAPNALNHSGSTFALSLYDQTGTQALLTSALDGVIAEVNVGPGGKVTAQTFPIGTGGNSAASIAAVPEPGSAALIGAGCAAVFGIRRRYTGKTSPAAIA